MKLLHIDSGILGNNSLSRRLTARLADRYRAAFPDLEVTYRDLAAAPLEHLSGAHVQAGDPSVHPIELQRDLASGASALDEFLAADVVVIGAPMYNFAVPSQLKAWIDRLAVAGKTFRYTAAGAEGLAGDKTVIVLSTRGGFYGSDTPLAAIDHQEPYLRAIFGFFGVTDLSFVRAEGVAIGEDVRVQALAEAERQIDVLPLERPAGRAQATANDAEPVREALAG